MRGLRNILVHQYFGVDGDIVRDVVTAHLPLLVEALRVYAEDDL
ncbi:HepT-like ribonuclease domain-containing protein [Tsukamurella ocularis]